jgi:ABC-type transport system involved in cytochrome c biogenesis permease subunit
MFAGIRRQLKLWWLLVPQPRAFSLGWGVAYLMIGGAGISTLVSPPSSLSGNGSPIPVILALGGLNLIGMCISMVSGYRDFWKGERLGISLMMSAAIIYAGITVHSHFIYSDSKAVQFFYIMFVVVVMAIRLFMIRWFTYRPRG